MSGADPQAFERDGLVRLSAVFRERDAAQMRGAIWDELVKQHGVERDEPETWSLPQATGFQRLTRADAFAALGSATLAAALDRLLGAGAWAPPSHWAAPLVTFPQQGAWRIPHAQWHLDFPARAPVRPLPGIRVLAFLDRVAPRGGGTLAIAGSHALVERLVRAGRAGDGRSPAVRAALRRTDPFFELLWSEADAPDRSDRLMETGATIDGVAVRVVELTGEAGDAVLMHPWQLHAPAPNAAASPRLMLSHSIVRASRQKP